MSTISTTMAKPDLDVPSEFICPITKALFVHPLMTRSGQNYERDAVLEVLKRGKGDCAVTQAIVSTLRPSDLVPNRQLERYIRIWRKSHECPSPASPSQDKQKSLTDHHHHQDDPTPMQCCFLTVTPPKPPAQRTQPEKQKTTSSSKNTTTAKQRSGSKGGGDDDCNRRDSHNDHKSADYAGAATKAATASSMGLTSLLRKAGNSLLKNQSHEDQSGRGSSSPQKKKSPLEFSPRKQRRTLPMRNIKADSPKRQSRSNGKQKLISLFEQMDLDN